MVILKRKDINFVVVIKGASKIKTINYNLPIINDLLTCLTPNHCKVKSHNSDEGLGFQKHIYHSFPMAF